MLKQQMPPDFMILERVLTSQIWQRGDAGDGDSGGPKWQNGHRVLSDPAKAGVKAYHPASADLHRVVEQSINKLVDYR